MAIARNRALDELVRARRRPQPEAVEELLAAAGREGLEEHALERERRAAVLRALRELPAEQRLVLVFGYFGGLSQAEIADRLGLPLGTVKKRVRLGMRKLRASLMADGAVFMDESKTIVR
jgi:RNA polymerase sigma-70 factor (ECF subfamily)